MTMYIAGSGLTFPDTSQQTTAGIFAPGTLMLFQQTAAPTGWTKQTTHNDKALRVVSGTAGSGGSVAFTTCFASGLSGGATTLSTSQMPSHNHQFANSSGTGGLNYSSGYIARGLAAEIAVDVWTYNSGGGGSHSHSLLSFAVQYVDLIIASKN